MSQIKNTRYLYKIEYKSHIGSHIHSVTTEDFMSIFALGSLCDRVTAGNKHKVSIKEPNKEWREMFL